VRQKNKLPFPCGWGVGKGPLNITFRVSKRSKKITKNWRMEMEEERELTFSDILRIFKRRKWTFLIIFFLTIFLSAVYLFFMATPKYEAKQVIEYKSSSSQPTVSLGAAANVLGISQPADSGLTTEIERMKADWVLANVVKELDRKSVV